MHRAVSVSLGSSGRDKEVTIQLSGKDVRLERHGADGDEKKAKAMFEELDGKVDAFGVGGVELGICLPWRDYPLRSGVNLVSGVTRTPYTDGHRLKKVLESRAMPFVESHLAGKIPNKKAFLVEAISRWGMTTSFLEAGYDCVFGDLMFALGIPVAIHTIAGLERAARLLLPVVSRMPISMLYSTGDAQKVNTPKYEKYYKEASIIAGDWLYIRKHMPEDMEGKVIITNTTTEEDVAFMKSRGIRYLVTTTPVFDGRSFGTNAFEAALIAAGGKGRVLENDELSAILDGEHIEPTIRDLAQQ
jgi:hypothetical protein